MTAAQIAGLAAHLPTTALATLSVFGNPSPNAAATGTSIPGIAGQVLIVNDAGTAVLFGQVNLSNTASVTGSLNATAYLTGIVSVPLGGSGTSALTANAVLYGNGTAALSVTNTTANGVLVTNGSSVPSLALTLPAVVQANITQVNTLTTGTWNASIVGVTWGGSGTNSLAANSVLLGNGTAAISAVANATSGYVLSANGTSSAATFQQFNLSNATGTLPFSNITSLAALSLLGNSSSAVTTVAAISGSASQVAVVNDAGTGLAFGRVNLGTSAAVTGTLSAGFGGTGNTTLTANAVLLGNGTSAVAFATIGTSGRAFLDQGAGANPSFKAIGGDLALTSAGTATIANNAVTFAKFQTVTGLSLIGVTGTATANAAAITGTADQVALVNHGGTGLVFGALNAAATAAITGSLYINLFNGGSSASTATFWRGDGTWVTPSGGGTVTSLTSGTGVTLSPSTITGTGTISLSSAWRTLPTTQAFTSSSGTYTTPANVQFIEIFAVGGGGGGGGVTQTVTRGAGGTGGTTTFNAVNAIGGSGAGNGTIAPGGAGGTGGTGTATFRAPGNPGNGSVSSNATLGNSGGRGGGSAFFAGGAVNTATATGDVANGGIGATNTGGGGSGAYNGTGNFLGAGGGGAGECFYLLIESPAATYTYTVGAGGTAGAGAATGGTGSAGFIFVKEYYGS